MIHIVHHERNTSHFIHAKGVTRSSGDHKPAWHAPVTAKVKKVFPKTCSQWTRYPKASQKCKNKTPALEMPFPHGTLLFNYYVFPRF